MEFNPGLLYQQLHEVVRGMGYELIEAQSAVIKGNHRVNVIVHSDHGIGTQDCVEISRTISPRLEILLNSQDVFLEVSSPGIERKIQSPHEFTVFKDRTAKILRYGEEEGWQNGIIRGYADGELDFEVDGHVQRIPVANINKAQLVYQEGR